MTQTQKVSYSFHQIAKQDIFPFTLDQLFPETQAYISQRIGRLKFSQKTKDRYISGERALPINRMIILDLDVLSESDDFSDYPAIITASRELIYALIIQQRNNLSGVFDNKISDKRNALFAAINDAGLMDALKANHGQVYSALTLLPTPGASRELATEYINAVPDLLPLFKLDPESKSIQDQFIKIYDYLKNDELLKSSFKTVLIGKTEEFQEFIEEHILMRQFEEDGSVVYDLSIHNQIIIKELEKISTPDLNFLKNWYDSLFTNTANMVRANINDPNAQMNQPKIYKLQPPNGPESINP